MNKSQSKKEYTKPQIKKVKLFSQEATLQFCKTLSTQTARSTKTCSQAPCKTTLGS